MPAPDDIDPIQDAKHARERGLARDATAAHTPGPWSLAVMKNGCVNIHHNRPDGQGWFRIAEVPVPGAYSASARHMFATQEEAAANARLIAAAPDLLAHLQFAVKLLGGIAAFGATAQVEAMRVAIRKATEGT